MMGDGPTIVRPFAFGHGTPLVVGLSTRIGGVEGSPFGMNLSYNVGDDPERVKENRRRFFGALDIRLEDIATMQQVHGNTVVRVDRSGSNPSCDAMITNRPGVYLCVTIADCVPVFVLDCSVNALAVIHAGWRGSAARIVSTAVEALQREFGAKPDQMEAFIGPSAGSCCYQVGEEVAGAFRGECVLVKDGRKYVDLKGENRKQLMGAGVPAGAIEIHPACTIHEGGVYHSFRRDGKLSGRMIGVAGFPEPRM
jgi:polyphenol oxidase